MSEVNYKSEVLEWIEDYKAGLVKPQKPFALLLREGWVIVTVPMFKGTFNRVGCKVEEDSRSKVWHTLHAILRVGEWMGEKCVWRPIWEYYKWLAPLPEAIISRRDRSISVPLGKWWIKVDDSFLSIFCVVMGAYVSPHWANDTPFTIEEAKTLLISNWPTKRIPKLLKP